VSSLLGERFAEEVSPLMTAAIEEADRVRHAYIGTEHVLLALIREPGPGGSLLLSLGADLDDARARLVSLIGLGHEKAAPTTLPFTPRLRSALRESVREASKHGPDQAGPIHILRAILASDGVAAQILVSLGIDPKDVVDVHGSS